MARNSHLGKGLPKLDLEGQVDNKDNRARQQRLEMGVGVGWGVGEQLKM